MMTRLAETKDPTDKGSLEPTYCKMHTLMSVSHSWKCRFMCMNPASHIYRQIRESTLQTNAKTVHFTPAQMWRLYRGILGLRSWRKTAILVTHGDRSWFNKECFHLIPLSFELDNPPPPPPPPLSSEVLRYERSFHIREAIVAGGAFIWTGKEIHKINEAK